ncbi:ATP/GTP-binding protein [Actinomyces bovis]|nr:ATP/GTP-binding protein [Actinomyces bovis]
MAFTREVPLQMFRGTSYQVCGLWPYVIGGATPEVGVPLGQVLQGSGMLCADHISWFRKGLISAPSGMVLGLNGLGKSSLIRRIILGLAYQGVHSMILGDIKPDYVDLVQALGGQVITVGHGRAGINPLDAGNVDEALALLAGRPQEQQALARSAHQRKKTLMISLIHIVRRRPPTEREEVVLDQAISLLEHRSGKPGLADLLAVIRQAPDELRRAAIDRGDIRRYRALVEDLEVSLEALACGRLGEIFSAPSTTAMMMDRSTVFDVSSLLQEDLDVGAAVLLACWSYGFATIEIAQTLADAGVAPRRHYNLVMDELWRILEASSGMVSRVNALTRLNRTIGVGQLMCTHSMADMNALASLEDRTKARGFVERSKMLFLGGLPSQEIDLLSGVMHFSCAEQKLLSSWNAPGTYNPYTDQVTGHCGVGKFLLKTSDAPGVAFQVRFAPGERALNDTSARWREEMG